MRSEIARLIDVHASYLANQSTLGDVDDAVQAVERMMLPEGERIPLHPAIAFPVHGIDLDNPKQVNALNAAVEAVYQIMSTGQNEGIQGEDDDDWVVDALKPSWMRDDIGSE